MLGAPKPNEEEAKEIMNGVYQQVQTLEDRLGVTTWVAGPEFTVADAQIYNELESSYSMVKFDLSAYPKVLAWLEACEKQEEILVEIKTKSAESVAARIAGLTKSSAMSSKS